MTNEIFLCSVLYVINKLRWGRPWHGCLIRGGLYENGQEIENGVDARAGRYSEPAFMLIDGCHLRVVIFGSKKGLFVPRQIFH